MNFFRCCCCCFYLLIEHGGGGGCGAYTKSPHWKEKSRACFESCHEYSFQFLSFFFFTLPESLNNVKWSEKNRDWKTMRMRK